MNYSSIQYKLPILMDYIYLMLKHIFFFHSGQRGTEEVENILLLVVRDDRWFRG